MYQNRCYRYPMVTATSKPRKYPRTPPTAAPNQIQGLGSGLPQDSSYLETHVAAANAHRNGNQRDGGDAHRSSVYGGKGIDRQVQRVQRTLCEHRENQGSQIGAQYGGDQPTNAARNHHPPAVWRLRRHTVRRQNADSRLHDQRGARDGSACGPADSTHQSQACHGPGPRRCRERGKHWVCGGNLEYVQGPAHCPTDKPGRGPAGKARKHPPAAWNDPLEQHTQHGSVDGPGVGPTRKQAGWHFSQRRWQDAHARGK